MVSNKYVEPTLAPLGGGSNPYGLTEREFQVVRLVLEGQTSKQVGLALDISYRTVEVHRARIMRKCGARNAMHLAHLLSGLAAESAARTERVFIEDISDAYDSFLKRET